MKSVFAFGKHFKSIFVVPKNTFATIDGIRAIGMFTIIIGHTAAIAAMLIDFNKLQDQIDATPVWLGWIWNAHYMVDVFFMMSGFLITALLINEYEKKGSITVKRFYFRRFFRLMPVYVVVVALFYAINLKNSENLWWNLLYINNFFDHDKTAAPWTWSLAVEEQFYVLFPWLFIYLSLSPKKRFPYLIALYFISIGIRALVLSFYPELYTNQLNATMQDHDLHNLYLTVVYDNLYTRFGGFIVGITGAYLYSYHSKPTKEFLNNTILGQLLVFSCLIIALLIFLTNLQKSQTNHPDWFIASYYILSRNLLTLSTGILMVAMIFENKISYPVGWFLKQKIWYAPAQLTYSAYLIHPVLVGFTLLNVKANYDARGGYVFSDPTMLSISVAIAVVLTYVLAAFLYVFVEKPLIVYRNNITHQKNFHEEEKEIKLAKQAG